MTNESFREAKNQLMERISDELDNFMADMQFDPDIDHEALAIAVKAHLSYWVRTRIAPQSRSSDESMSTVRGDSGPL